MDKTTIIILVGYLIFFGIIFLLFPKENEVIKYHVNKFIKNSLKFFEPIVFELKRYLLLNIIIMSSENPFNIPMNILI